MTPEARERRRIRRPVLAVTAVAWAVILLEGSLGPRHWAGRTLRPIRKGRLATGHAHHATGDAGLSALHGSSEIAGGVVFGWVLMLTAMMAPLLIPALRHARARSLRSRRCRAMSLVAVAAAAVWTVGGAVLLAVAAALRAITEDAGLALMLGLVAVVIWQCSPLKQYCLNRHCAGPPIAAFGAAADRDALRFGTTHAAWCLGSCWGPRSCRCSRRPGTNPSCWPSPRGCGSSRSIARNGRPGGYAFRCASYASPGWPCGPWPQLRLSALARPRAFAEDRLARAGIDRARPWLVRGQSSRSLRTAHPRPTIPQASGGDRHLNLHETRNTLRSDMAIRVAWQCVASGRAISFSRRRAHARWVGCSYTK